MLGRVSSINGSHKILKLKLKVQKSSRGSRRYNEKYILAPAWTCDNPASQSPKPVAPPAPGLHPPPRNGRNGSPVAKTCLRSN